MAVLDVSRAPRVAASHMTDGLGPLLGVVLAFAPDETCMPYAHLYFERLPHCDFGHEGRSQLNVTPPSGALVAVHLGEPATVETSFGPRRFTNVTGYGGGSADPACQGFGILVTRP